MRFCDKLPKLRKENNLSQELLAEKLGLSRQAISKWESGSSYPDMGKLLEMCKILNCTLEDLLDDGSISKTKNVYSKFNFTNYYEDFLSFVTKVYNMFCAMSFKGKIKCLLELVFIAFVLWILSFLVFSIFDNTIFRLLLDIPYLGSYMHFLIGNLFTIILIVISVIIFIHLFKIRYLDYYVTVEDQNVKEKVLEKPVENKQEIDNKKERIIIRDPKHSKFSFFEFLATVVIVMFKIIMIFIAIPAIIIFITLIIFFFMSIYHLKFGIIFLCIALVALGLSSLNYVVLEFIYNFIISKKQNFKRIFIIIMSGFILTGAGTGLGVSTYINFKEASNLPEEFRKENIVSLDISKNMVLLDNHFVYEIDNKISNLNISSKNSLVNINVNTTYDNNYNVTYVWQYLDSQKMIKLLYDDLKNKNRRDYNDIYDDTLTVMLSKENYNKIIQNYDNYSDY